MTPHKTAEVKPGYAAPLKRSVGALGSQAATWLGRVLTPYVVLAAALLMTCLVAYQESATTRTKNTLRFETLTRETRDLIASRLHTYETLLRAGAGVFAASQEVTRSEFAVFARTLDVRKNYPGLQGIGYAARFRPEGKNVLEERMRRQGIGDFTVHPGGDRDDYTAVIYIEPQDQLNRSSVGFDMLTDPVQREAMIRARDSGNAAASGAVSLPQENGRQKEPGFLIYFPVYSPGPAPRTVAQRRIRLVGYIYCPLRSAQMLATMVEPARQEILDIEIYDGPRAEPQLVIFDSWAHHPPDWHSHGLTRTATLRFGGHVWTMRTAARPTFRSAADTDRSIRVLLTGGAVSLLLFALTLSQSKARRQAEQSAVELAASREELLKANQRTTTIMESITDGLIAVNPAWEVIYVNHQALEMGGRSREETAGRELWAVYPGLAGTEAEALLREAMNTGTAVQFEAAGALMQGWADIRGYPSSDGLALYFADITGRKNAEKTLVEAYRHQRQIATTLQEALLAVDIRTIEGITIEPYYRAAHAEALVGGDFYDIFEPAPGLLGIVIGDVAGKGLAAATRTAFVRSTLRALAYEEPAPASVLTRLNRIVGRETQDGFVTLLYGLLDIHNRRFQFANAGHEPPLLMMPGNPAASDLQRPGVVLGVVADYDYEQFGVDLGRGCQTLFYTDGITEARRDSDFYGIERLKTAFVKLQEPSAADTLKAVIDDVNSFARGQIRDDVAAILLRFD